MENLRNLVNENINTSISNMRKPLAIRKGDIYWCDLGSNNVGSEQNGKRPVVIIQNDVGNKFSPTVIVAVITSQMSKAKLPTHVAVSSTYGLDKDSVILFEQLRTVDKRRLGDYVGRLDDKKEEQVKRSLMISMGIM